MLSKPRRRIALVALLAGVVVLVRAVLDDASHDTTSRSSAPSPHQDRVRDAPSKTGAPAARVSTGVDRSMQSVTEASRLTQAPVRLEVRAPADVRVGDVFEARVDIDASVPVRDLMFSIVYEKSRLSLVGRSEGPFIRQSGVPFEFGVDEPSDGNIDVVFRAVNGSAATGSGSIAAFEFEAIKPGTSGIELTNVKSFDAGGETSTNVLVAHDRVTIH